MVDSTNFAYRYNGELQNLLAGVKKSCTKMALVIKKENIYEGGFSILAAQKTNWLSTNWPVKFNIEAESIGNTYALVIRGDSSMGSITQSANNHAKALELLSFIKVYAPSNNDASHQPTPARMTQPPHKGNRSPTATSAATDTCSVQNPSAFYPTFFLALFLGVFGVHRFYLAKIGTGVLQLFTFGGFGVWWLVDMITILFGKFRDKKGAVIPNVNPKVSWSVFAIFVIIGLASRGTNSSLSTSTSNSEGASIMASGMDPAVTRSAPLRPSQPLKPSVYIPEDQQDFINAIVPFIKQYQNAPNELKKSVIRAARSEAIEKVVPSCQVRNWVGTLKKLGTTSDGKAYIEIALEGTKNVTVKTWNNAFSDTTDKTLIELNSPLFIKLSDMTEGTRVSFSGIFIRGEQDYLRESSVTEHGLMTDPEFIMSFFDVSNNHE